MSENKQAVPLSSSQLTGFLSSISPAIGKRLLPWPEAFQSLPFAILEDTTVANEPEIHVKEGDLWQCLEGEMKFVCGGELDGKFEKQRPDGSSNPDELGGTTIIGGIEYILHQGDWLWIPPGVPHQHGAEGSARLVIIKIRV
jgi:mannose-6-phosphate isomerase-like protein (cupin superfamily)